MLSPDRPRRELLFDVESRSTYDVTDVGPYIYATHPTTEIQFFTYAVDDGPILIWRRGDPPPQPFIDAAENIDTWTIYAHNAGFDRPMHEHILVKRHGFPPLALEQWRCTMAQGLAAALPGRLERLAKVLNLEHQKDKAGSRLMKQMAKPRKPRKGEDPTATLYFDDPVRMAGLEDYGVRDTAAMREAHYGLPDLIPFEQQVWLLDQKINGTGFYLDQELALAANKIAEDANPIINAELTQLTNGQVTAFTQVAKLTEWLAQWVPVESLNKATIEELLDQELPEHVRRALELRHLGAQAAVAKVDALLQRRCPDGRVRDCFVYHAAGTGRWSSRGAQVHNLKRPQTDFSKDEGAELRRAIEIIGSGDLALAREHYDNPLSVIGDCIRAMIVAAPGHTLIGGDFSGIEARVTAWIAGEKSKLDVFRAYDEGRGPDPYVIFAASVFTRDPEELSKAYKAGDPVAREQRQIGKAGELAFGFQGGVKAYRRFSPGGAPAATTASQSAWMKLHGAFDRTKTPLAGTTTEFTDLEVNRIKNTWRRLHPNVVRFWDNIDRATYKAVTNPGCTVTFGNLSLMCDDSPMLWLTLPSGRSLAYPHIRKTRAFFFEGKIVEHERGEHCVLFKDAAMGQWRDVKVYGGLLTENIVQAIARDLLAEAMIRVDRAGFRIVAHVHDEIVIEVPKAKAAAAEVTFTKLMSQCPPWAKGLPIKVGSWSNERYIK
jgi:DNA polymerase